MFTVALLGLGVTGLVIVLRSAQQTFPPAIYRPARFPSWGLSSGCPSLEGVIKPQNVSATEILNVLSRLGIDEQMDLSLSDQAYWPVVRETWSAQHTNPNPPGKGDRTQYTADQVISGPAAKSDYAELISTNCGGRTVELSWWVAVCPKDAPKPCRVEANPSLVSQFLLIRRDTRWLLWFSK